MEVRQSSCFCITVKPKNIEELKIKTAVAIESMMTEMLKKKYRTSFNDQVDIVQAVGQ